MLNVHRPTKPDQAREGGPETEAEGLPRGPGESCGLCPVDLASDLAWARPELRYRNSLQILRSKQKLLITEQRKPVKTVRKTGNISRTCLEMVKFSSRTWYSLENSKGKWRNGRPKEEYLREVSGMEKKSRWTDWKHQRSRKMEKHFFTKMNELYF